MKRADNVKWLYRIIQYIIIKEFKYILQLKLRKNCPMIVEDVDVILDICSKNIVALKSKNIIKKSSRLPNIDYVELLSEIKYIRKEISIDADIIYINLNLF